MFKKLYKKYRYWKAMRIVQGRNITRARFLYFYFIISGIGMVLYAISCLITGFPFYLTFSPMVLSLMVFLFIILKKNGKLFWLYLKDMERGKLLMRLNDYTNYEEQHKLKLIDWVYLKRKTIRREELLALEEKAKTNKELSQGEKRRMKYRVVFCPQQVLDGINKTILVSNLIYAHENIQVLDDSLREILELTDANMLKFDLQKEIDKCRTHEHKEKIDRLTKIGKAKLKAKK